MSILERVYTATVTAISMGLALLKIAVGLAMVAGCVLVAVHSWATPGVDLLTGLAVVKVLIAIVAVCGLVIIITSLGIFVGVPSPERNAKRETRKALRRARMLRR
jgi:hypothetical protein